MTPHWIDDAVFYHIYPLAMCDAPVRNDFAAAPVNRLQRIADGIDHLRSLGVNSLYLGPLFESTAHGYDTADYFQVDRRLGTRDDLRSLTGAVKRAGIRTVLDGVFNHVGRDFWAFRDVQQHGAASAYRDWFANLHFGASSPDGDPFSYEGWAGHYDLVRLNLWNPDVRRHLFDAITFWIETFDIDGLRLDAADVLDHDFIRALSAHCRALKPDFWLMGEVVHGDYRRWANADMLDATTNYEVYKGLYSSHVDRNYFELAYALNRQFGDGGMYRHLRLYNFADNHDVNRVASNLTDPAHLYPLYGLLFTMPGVPSIYYGSEWGVEGKRTPTSDRALRPCLDLTMDPACFPQPNLTQAIRRFADLRAALSALRCGDYRQLHVASEQFAFARRVDGQTVVVAVNASHAPQTVTLSGLPGSLLRDRLNAPDSFAVTNGRARVSLPPTWLRVMQVA